MGSFRLETELRNHFTTIMISGRRFAESRGRRFRQGTVLLAAAALLAQFTLCAGLNAQSGTCAAKGAQPGERPAPDVFSRVADAGTAADHGGAPYVIVYDCAKNKVKPTGVTYVDRYTIYKVLHAGRRARPVGPPVGLRAVEQPR